MCIDWIAERKPIAGKEKEFKKLLKIFNDTKKTSNEELIDKAEMDFYNISISPYDSLNTDEGFDENNDDIDILFSSSDIFDSNLINEELKDEICENHGPKETIDFANRLEEVVSTINIYNLDEDELDNYNEIIFAIKWLKFWGERGHGFIVSN